MHEDFDAALQMAVLRLPKDIMSDPAESAEDRFAPDVQPAADDAKDGNLVIDDGEVWQRQGDAMVRRTDLSKNQVAIQQDSADFAKVIKLWIGRYKVHAGSNCGPNGTRAKTERRKGNRRNPRENRRNAIGAKTIARDDT
jgi:hypothetical protein